MNFEQPNWGTPFKRWLLENKENRRLILLSFIFSTCSFILLKLLYPLPNFMPPDSFAYIESARDNDFIAMWAIGYSKFLRLVSSISSSDLVLVIFQYLLLQLSLLYFLFTIRYMILTRKWIFRIVLTITNLNPLVAHISNFVSSDCLFVALSLLWLTQLIWIANNPSFKLLIYHSFTFLLAIMVRHNALFYPLISFIIIAISSLSRSKKWMGASFGLLVLLIFIGRTQYEYYKRTNTVQYSAFGGWQIAANGLYGYSHADRSDTFVVPARFINIHSLVNKHIDSIRHLQFRPDDKIGVYYLWDFNSPLRIYMEQRWAKDSTTSYFQKWAIMAPFYSSYGRLLITRYPLSFLKYFLWPNLKRYFAPPTLFMGMYNLGNPVVEPVASSWFNWKNNQVYTNAKNASIGIAEVFTVVFPIINIVFIAGFLANVILYPNLSFNNSGNKTLIIGLMVWIVNLIFSVVSAPIELRYQLFPLFFIFILDALLIEGILKKMEVSSTNENMPFRSYEHVPNINFSTKQIK